MEVIILAGGLGTRLRSVIGEALPKCMAPVAGKPFLHYLFDYLLAQEVVHSITLALGHGSSFVLDWWGKTYPHIRAYYFTEDEPLGTGGAIRAALTGVEDDYAIVINGDSFFNLPLEDLERFHLETNAETTIALKGLRDFDRYGTVGLGESSTIISFEEKAPRAAGLINGGVYCIDKKRFLARPFPEKFSFETDYLQAVVGENVLYGYKADGYFIDIGIPQDYERAQNDFAGTFPPAGTVTDDPKSEI